MNKNEGRVSITLRLPKALKDALKDKAVAGRRSINDQIIVLLENALKQDGYERNTGNGNEQ